MRANYKFSTEVSNQNISFFKKEIYRIANSFPDKAYCEAGIEFWPPKKFRCWAKIQSNEDSIAATNFEMDEYAVVESTIIDLEKMALHKANKRNLAQQRSPNC